MSINRSSLKSNSRVPIALFVNPTELASPLSPEDGSSSLKQKEGRCDISVQPSLSDLEETIKTGSEGKQSDSIFMNQSIRDKVKQNNDESSPTLKIIGNNSRWAIKEQTHVNTKRRLIGSNWCHRINLHQNKNFENLKIDMIAHQEKKLNMNKKRYSRNQSQILKSFNSRKNKDLNIVIDPLEGHNLHLTNRCERSAIPNLANINKSNHTFLIDIIPNEDSIFETDKNIKLKKAKKMRLNRSKNHIFGVSSTEKSDKLDINSHLSFARIK